MVMMDRTLKEPSTSSDCLSQLVYWCHFEIPTSLDCKGKEGMLRRLSMGDL